MSKYQELAGRTVSPHCYAGSVPAKQLLGMLELITVAGEYADAQKRAYFYGKSYLPDQRLDDLGENAQAKLQVIETPGFSKDLLHALLGIVSEAAEISEAILESCRTGEPLDLVNLAEEAGDIRWYSALLATSLGKDEADVEDANIAKLQTRFPERFTEENAGKRDLGAERSVLEQRFNEVHFAAPSQGGWLEDLWKGSLPSLSYVNSTPERMRTLALSDLIDRAGAAPAPEPEPECCDRKFTLAVSFAGSRGSHTWDLDCQGVAILQASLDKGFLEVRDVDFPSTSTTYPLSQIRSFELDGLKPDETLVA